MRVSVIVPVYNTAKYLRQCLQSLREQTLKDIEIICVNDGSTDDSRQIIDEVTAADNRFKSIHKNNTGYGHSVNMGIRAAQGQYIGIVESDDFAEPDMFRSLYNAAERNQVDFVKGNYNTYRENAAWPRPRGVRKRPCLKICWENFLTIRFFRHKIIRRYSAYIPAYGLLFTENHSWKRMIYGSRRHQGRPIRILPLHLK